MSPGFAYSPEDKPLSCPRYRRERDCPRDRVPGSFRRSRDRAIRTGQPMSDMRSVERGACRWPLLGLIRSAII
jgi:hypothetical protein